MRETLEKLSEEEDYSRLKEGLEEFYKKNKGVLHLFGQDAMKLRMDVMNAIKVAERGPIGKQEADAIKHYLDEAVKELRAAEKEAHDILHAKFRAA